VLHDMFAMPFDETPRLVDRLPPPPVASRAAAASAAPHRPRGRPRQRKLVEVK
jgi:hypothetical protein